MSATATKTTVVSQQDADRDAAKSFLSLQRGAQWRQRFLCLTGAGLFAMWLSLGMARFANAFVIKQFGVALPVLLYDLVAAAVVTFLFWSAARSMQLARLAEKEPEDILYISRLTDLTLSSYPDPGDDLERARTRRRTLDAFWQLYCPGLDRERAGRDSLYRLVALGAILVLMVALDLAIYGVTGPDAVQNVLMAVLPAGVIVALILPCSEAALSLPVPDSAEGPTAYQIEQQTLQVEGKAKKDHDKALQAIQQQKQQQAKVAAHSDWQRTRRDLLRLLSQKAAAWEVERNFNEEERAFMSVRRPKLTRQKWIAGIAAFLFSLVATYPASLAWNHSLGGSYSYWGGLRVAPMLWGVWIGLMLIVEIILGASVLHLGVVAYAYGVRENAYRIDQRKHGFTYLILSGAQTGFKVFLCFVGLAICLFALGFEIRLNLQYYQSLTGREQTGGAFLAFVPFVGFLLMGAWLSSLLYQLHWVADALDLPALKPDPVRTAPYERRAESAIAQDEYKARGFRDPGKN